VAVNEKDKMLLEDWLGLLTENHHLRNALEVAKDELYRKYLRIALTNSVFLSDQDAEEIFWLLVGRKLAYIECIARANEINR